MCLYFKHVNDFFSYIHIYITQYPNNSQNIPISFPTRKIIQTGYKDRFKLLLYQVCKRGTYTDSFIELSGFSKEA